MPELGRSLDDRAPWAPGEIATDVEYGGRLVGYYCSWLSQMGAGSEAG